MCRYQRRDDLYTEPRGLVIVAYYSPVRPGAEREITADVYTRYGARVDIRLFQSGAQSVMPVPEEPCSQGAETQDIEG